MLFRSKIRMVAPSHQQQESSYSMLFSPAGSSLVSTPGGVPPPSTHNTIQQQHQQNHPHPDHHPQQELDLNWDPNRVKSELLKSSAILSHRCLKLAGKWAAEQATGIPGIANPVVVTTKTTATGTVNDGDINEVDLSFNTHDCSIEQEEEEDP